MAKENNDTQVSAAEVVAKQLTDLQSTVQQAVAGVDEMRGELEELRKPQRESFGAPNVITGELPSSRKMSLFRASRAMILGDMGAAKLERELSMKLCQELGGDAAGVQRGTVMYFPLDMRKLPVEDSEEAEVLRKHGLEAGWVSKGLYQELAQCGGLDVGRIDYEAMSRMSGVHHAILAKGYRGLTTKDLTIGGATTGQDLHEAAGLGELIDFLRPLEIFSRAGVREITLPRSGRIDLPRFTSDPTANAFAEDATITESTPGTDTVSLDANKYGALIEFSAELLRFASIDLEAHLRFTMASQLALDFDQDQIDGASAAANTEGWILKTNVNTRTAGTTGANGDTLLPDDLTSAMGDVSGSSVSLETFHWAVRPELWFGLMGRRADAVSAADGAGQYLLRTHFNPFVGTPQQFGGYPVIASANVPNDRTKGSGTNLTLALGFAAAEWIIGRHGVVEVRVTDSHASNFAVDRSAIKATVFQDANALHDEGAVFIDDLLNS